MVAHAAHEVVSKLNYHEKEVHYFDQAEIMLTDEDKFDKEYWKSMMKHLDRIDLFAPEKIRPPK